MLTSPTNRPRIYITMGDPAGIGPEVIMRTLASPEVRELAFFVVVGDERIVKEASSGVLPGDIEIVDPGPPLEDITPGRSTTEGAAKALRCIDQAIKFVRDAKDNVPKGIVTAPVSKEAIARVHPGFVGHTEHLQEAFSSSLVTMVMVGKNFSVVPVTRHIPIKDVASSLSTSLILGTLEQVIENRRVISGKDDPHISVTSLNPHAGEGGKIGTEETEVIQPAISKAKTLYSKIDGPFASDTVFYHALNKRTDIVISMYHDQCLAPFKMIHFEDGINMTLGLGCVRTSPDHGTAFDIAGKNIAKHASMENAIKLAIRALAK